MFGSCFVPPRKMISPLFFNPFSNRIIMKVFSFAFLVQFVLFSLLIVPTISSSSAESTQHDFPSVAMTSSEEDVTSARADVTVHGISRVLRKKRKKSPKGGKVSKSAKGSAKKNPKGGKVSKSAKGSASPSSQPTSPPTSPPTDDPCASISDQKDALLALKDGFGNGDTVLSDWSVSTEPCSDDTSNWGATITCNSSGEVLEIDLGKSNVS